MAIRTRARRAGLAAAVATIAMVGLNPLVALANTGAPPLVSARNASDPHTDMCFMTENNVLKPYLCMYTSSDLDYKVDGSYYPMDTTYVYTLDLSASPPLNPADPASWVDRSGGGNWPAFRESSLPLGPRNMKHLWAPTMHYGNKTRETLLYVPDINANYKMPNVSEDGYVSYIAVASDYDSVGNLANTPWGPFTYKKNITYNGADIRDYYMSDPAVATLGQTHPDNGGPATWLLWANGDANKANQYCGGISIGRLKDDDLTDLVDDPARASSEITINGIAAELGTCTGLNHPYLEGPELYDLTPTNLPAPTTGGVAEPYVLFFAAKPNGGTHGVTNQVLAYATASTPKGLYNYRGIIMEASDKSWTNHGSIFLDTTTGPDLQTQLRFTLYFHDETNNASPHNRKARAACLTYDLSDRKFLPVPRPATMPDLGSCQGTRP